MNTTRIQDEDRQKQLITKSEKKMDLFIMDYFKDSDKKKYK